MKMQIKLIGVLVIISLLLICEPVNATVFDDITKDKIKNNELIINSIIPKTETEAQNYITYKLFSSNKTFKDYTRNSSWSYGVYCKNDCNEDFSGTYTLRICINNSVDDCEERDINIIFDDSKLDSKIANMVNKYLNEFPEGKQYNIWPSNPVEHVIFIDDIELISYISKLNWKYEPVEDLRKGLGILNYNKNYRELTKGFNLAEPWGFAGNGCDIALSNMNNLIYEYNDVIYGKSDFKIRTFILNAIYIEDNADISDNTKLLKAVEDRIKEELGNIATVSIGDNTWLASTINELEEDYKLSEYDVTFDENKVSDQVVNIKIKGNDYPFIVIKDSSKIKKINNVTTKDFLSNSSIEYNSKFIPADSKIRFKQKFDNNTILNKLNLLNGVTFDISLFSSTFNDYINGDNTNDFTVTIPIADSLKNKELAVYYIDINGNIEKYNVEINGNFAIFKTKHFSEYTIGASSLDNSDENSDEKIGVSSLDNKNANINEKNSNEKNNNGKIKNPKTYDSIYSWILLLLASLFGISLIIIKKEKNKLIIK